MWPVHQDSTLVEVDDSMHIKPLLAERWEVSGDRKEILFYLRQMLGFMMMPVLKMERAG